MYPPVPICIVCIYDLARASRISPTTRITWWDPFPTNPRPIKTSPRYSTRHPQPPVHLRSLSHYSQDKKIIIPHRNLYKFNYSLLYVDSLSISNRIVDKSCKSFLFSLNHVLILIPFSFILSILFISAFKSDVTHYVSLQIFPFFLSWFYSLHWYLTIYLNASS